MTEAQREQHLLDCPDTEDTIKRRNASLFEIVVSFFTANMSVECPYVDGGPSHLSCTNGKNRLAPLLISRLF